MLEIDTKYDAEAKLWEGPKIKQLYNPKLSIGQVILNMLTLHGPKIAQISDDSGVKITFNELLTKTIRVAQNLQKIDHEPRSVVGILTNNSADVAPIIYASLCLGCPISLFDPSFTKFEIKSIISISKPKTFFCDVSVHSLLEASLKESQITARVFTFDGQRGNSISVDTLFAETDNETSFLPVDIDGEKEAAIIATSFGVSGTLEGICLSHALLLDKCTRLHSISCGEILFTFSSLYWLSGIGNLLKATYFGATRIITTKPYAPELLLQLIEKYKITHLFATSQQLLSALSHESIDKMDLASVKSIAFSGEKVSHDQYSSMRKYFKNAMPYIMFGISELGGAISISRGEQLKLNASGRLVNGTQVKIVDEDGKRLGIGERGQIYVRSAYHFLGYYGKEGTESIIDQEQFLKTGKIGYFDHSGFLFVIGREIDMIKYQHHQISPLEIEYLLGQNPSIETVCVVDVTKDNLLAALIVPNKDATISEENVLKLVSDNFDDSHKLRGGVYFVKSLPSTPSGKKIRRVAKGIAEKEFSSRNQDSKTT